MIHRSIITVALMLILAACAGQTRAGSVAPPAASAAPAAVCTPGQDQTCNDDEALSSLHGTCNPDRTCTCSGTWAKNPQTGRCK